MDQMRNTLNRMLVAVLLATLFTLPLFGQRTDLPPPKRELRGAWVATVANIDFPKRGTPNGIAQKEQWKKLIERLKKTGFNAVFVQIRPAGDALYESDIAPWSAFLTGKQGQAPVPYYDPLEFMIEFTHRCGMEFHAWMNPYRATFNLDTTSLSRNHVFNEHRDWVLRYGNKFYLDPGIPEVQRHLNSVVQEVLEKYDVDGIHFDDYFYPYRIQGQEFPDTASFAQYGQTFGSVEDWRRDNIDRLIETLFQTIKVTKPHVAFGISPFGVWRNRSDDPMGSRTRAGQRSYDDLYADVLKWLKNGWIDYVVPQLYWHIGFPAADHAELFNWWQAHSYDQKLYIGYAAYKVGDNPDPAWQEGSQIPEQLRLNRRAADVEGGIFFSTKSVLNNPLGLADSLAREFWRYPALVPTLTEEGVPRPSPPILRRIKGKQEGVLLRWKKDKSAAANPFLPPDYQVIYRFDGPVVGDMSDPSNILTITSLTGEQNRFLDRTAIENRIYTYAITSVNRHQIESPLGESRTIRKKLGGIKRLKNRRLRRVIREMQLENQEAEDAGLFR